MVVMVPSRALAAPETTYRILPVVLWKYKITENTLLTLPKLNIRFAFKVGLEHFTQAEKENAPLSKGSEGTTVLDVMPPVTEPFAANIISSDNNNVGFNGRGT